MYTGGGGHNVSSRTNHVQDGSGPGSRRDEAPRAPGMLARVPRRSQIFAVFLMAYSLSHACRSSTDAVVAEDRVGAGGLSASDLVLMASLFIRPIALPFYAPLPRRRRA